MPKPENMTYKVYKVRHKGGMWWYDIYNEVGKIGHPEFAYTKWGAKRLAKQKIKNYLTPLPSKTYKYKEK